MPEPTPAPAPADPAANPPANPAPADPAPPANPAPADPANPAPADPNPADPPADPADPAKDPADPADPPKDEPIVYADFNLPEGFTLDEEVGNKFKEFAAAKKLSQEEAQALLDLSLEADAKRAAAYQAEQQGWVEQAKADKEYGGDKFDKNLAVANKAVDAFCTPEMVGLLKSTGFGNHPEVIRTFFKIGNAIGEDKLLTRDPVSNYNDGKSIAQRLYPNMNP